MACVFFCNVQTSEKEQIEREKGVGKAVGASEAVEYKIEIPANRLGKNLCLFCKACTLVCLKKKVFYI